MSFNFKDIFIFDIFLYHLITYSEANVFNELKLQEEEEEEEEHCRP